MPRVITKYINGNKVIRTVKKDGLTDSFGERDMVFACGFNTGASPRWAKFDFKVNQQRVLIRVLWGNNTYKMYEFLNVTSATISMNPNEGDNGTAVNNFADFQVYLYLSNPEDITFFETSTNGVNNRIGSGSYYLNPNRCINVSRIKATNVDSTNVSGIANLKIVQLEISSNNPSSLTNDFQRMNLLKHCFLNRWSGNMNVFHPNLRFLELNTFTVTQDLSSFFNSSNRMGLILRRLYTGGGVLSYNGGAIFAPNIVEETGMPIPYILLLNNTNYWATKLTPDMVSRFLLDFANQVLSVTLANKRINFGGHTANTAYEDLTQPIYKNYTSAMSYITGTLGITVTF